MVKAGEDEKFLKKFEESGDKKAKEVKKMSFGERFLILITEMSFLIIR